EGFTEDPAGNPRLPFPRLGIEQEERRTIDSRVKTPARRNREAAAIRAECERGRFERGLIGLPLPAGAEVPDHDLGITGLGRQKGLRPVGGKVADPTPPPREGPPGPA